jgi:hypothetical protein
MWWSIAGHSAVTQAKGEVTWPGHVKANIQVCASDVSQRPASLFSSRSSKTLGQLLIHMPTLTDGHQANDSCSLIDGIDDAKAANAILSEPVEPGLDKGMHRTRRDPTVIRSLTQRKSSIAPAGLNLPRHRAQPRSMACTEQVVTPLRPLCGSTQHPSFYLTLPPALTITPSRRESSMVSYCAHAPSTKQNLFDPEPITIILATG